jgi:hypothetical protein
MQFKEIQGMAWHGMARNLKAWHGKEIQGMERKGEARICNTWHDMA